MSDEIKKPSFLVYYDNEIIVLRLPDEEAGKLFKSLFPYGREKIKPDFDKNPALAMAFDILSMAIDRDKEKYVRRCEANRENGRKGGLAKATNSKQSLPNGKQCLANLADKDRDKDKEKDKEKDKGMDMYMDRDKDKDRERDIQPSGNQVPAECRTSDNQMTTKCHTEDSLGKDRIGKSSLSKDRVSKDKERIDYQQIADMYNDTCVSFPRLTRLSDSRKNAIKAGLRQYSIEDFQKLFTMAEESSFLKGQNKRNWSANFDWLIQDSNMAKVLDGNYVDRKEMIKAEIYKIAHTHISEKAFERYHDQIHDLICLCCPLEGFTQEQVDYMLHEWGSKPLSEKYVLKAPEEDSYSHWDQKLKKSLPSSLGGADERQDAK